MDDEDEEAIRQLMEDVTTGNLHKRRRAHMKGLGYLDKGFDLESDEEDDDTLLRQMRKYETGWIEGEEGINSSSDAVQGLEKYGKSFVPLSIVSLILHTFFLLPPPS